MPDDLTNENIKVPGRDVAPVITVPLTGIGPDGKAQTIEEPPGQTKVFQGSTNVLVHDFTYSQTKLSIPEGASITWRFPDTTSHDVTLANGPYGFASPFSRIGRTYTQRFTRPGRYKLFCSLHPVVMHELVDVRPAGSAAAASKARRGPPTGAGGPRGGSAQIHW
jgi:plastocyanin